MLDYGQRAWEGNRGLQTRLASMISVPAVEPRPPMKASQAMFGGALSFFLMMHSPVTGWGERLGLFTGPGSSTSCDSERDIQRDIARIKGSRDEFYCYETFDPPRSKWW